MRLEEYWGVGPKTRELLEDELGTEEAIEAIEAADIRRLSGAGLPRGRATRILRRAKGGEGLDVLATRDTRDVYKRILDIVSEYAVTADAADRIKVMTPLLSHEDAERRLEKVLEAKESWDSLPDEKRNEVIDAFDDYDEDGESERAAVEAALALKEADLSGSAFSGVRELDSEALRDASDALAYLGSGGEVLEGADSELDSLRRTLDDVDELEDRSLDVVEEIRSAGARATDEFEDAFLNYVTTQTDVSFDRVTNSMPDEALDATDFVTGALRNLASNLRDEFEKKQEEVAERLEDDIDEARDDVDAAVEAVDELGFTLSLARFASEYDLNRPAFLEDGQGVAVVNARNLGLIAGGQDVQPVSYAIGKHSLDSELPREDLVSVLTGANSGGKTTLLETLCEVVLLAQMGLPVPAEEVQIGVFDSVVFHRRHASFNAGVLESTLRSVVPPLTRKGNTLMLVDEFEAITEPGSAADLLHGIVELTVEKGAAGVFVTHLAEDLEPLPEEARIDGIFAEGLDEDLALKVDYQPRFETLGKSTPEFIVSRLVANASDRVERAGFETLASAVGEEKVQSTLEAWED